MRQPKPFFRQFTKSWYVTLNGRQVPLGRDEAKAWEKYHQLMASRHEFRGAATPVAKVFDAYLAWVKANRAETTYTKVQQYLSDFAKHIGSGVRVSTLKVSKVTSWLAANPQWSSTTGNDAVSVVQRAFNWAVRHGHLEKSPIAHVPDKPAKRRRETVFNHDDWHELRGLVADQEFGDFLDFMWETGCRPLEARTVEARHLDLAHGLVIFPPSEAKGQQNERVVFLTDKAIEICERNASAHRKGAIFRNLAGKPWTKNSINNRFVRLRKKFKRPANAYAIRHSYATDALIRGCDSTTLAQLLGHQDTTMISRTYAHLSRNPQYLAAQAKRLRETATASSE